MMSISSFHLNAQENTDAALQFGAEIFIEPGQSEENVEGWFKLLAENNMSITRIRMFESYMKNEKGGWDFSLFDKAFKYGEKYNINIYANLFPETAFTDVGGFKFPHDRAHLDRIAEYIKNVVLHFNEFSSLYGWVPINEPGGVFEPTPLSREIAEEWKKSPLTSMNNPLLNTPHLSFDEEEFLLYYNTWYLQWLTNEIRKYDKGRPIHVNTHQIFEHIDQYDFPAWREFLTSLGGSAHASWHFGYFPRHKYALALSANSEIILSGAGELPWFMTELQGGNNIYSGYDPLCPTKEEIAQWLWISVATGSKGAIFWCLNPRMSGAEAGEWGMVDFQNQPTDRFTEAGKIAGVIHQNEDLFRLSKPVNSPIHILYNRESLWVEGKMVPEVNLNLFEVRSKGAAIKSAISYFEALSQLGLQPTIKEFNEFSFAEKDYTGQAIILAHQIAMPDAYHDKIRCFVRNGGTLIVDGLTAFYNEKAMSAMVNDFWLADLMGGSVSEFIFGTDIFPITIQGNTLPAHALKGIIHGQKGSKLNDETGEVLATLHHYGKGRVLWLPSLLGLGARKTGDYQPLVDFLKPYLFLKNELCFDTYQEGVIMKNLLSRDSLITVIINKNASTKRVQLVGAPFITKKSRVLYTGKNSLINKNIVEIEAEDTLVILWH